MLVTGNLRATNNGQPVNATLPQNQVGAANFYVDVPPLNVQQRLDLKALFQKAGITTQNGKESEAAGQFLQKLLDLAQSAGGSAPRPPSHNAQNVRALQMQSAATPSLLKIHEQKDSLAANLATWKKNTDAIAKRWPVWERLVELRNFAKELTEAEAYATSMDAIIVGPTLLADPDPVPELTKQLVAALRTALRKLQEDLAAAFKVRR